MQTIINRDGVEVGSLVFFFQSLISIVELFEVLFLVVVVVVVDVFSYG